MQQAFNDNFYHQDNDNIGVKLMNGKICPYLGLNDDSATAYSYPSKANYCYHATPIAAVKLDYQKNYCLSDHHIACELFQKKSEGNKKLPAGIIHQTTRSSLVFRKVLLKLFIIVSIASIFIWIALFWPEKKLNTVSGNNSEITSLITSQYTKTPTITVAIPTPSSSLVESTPTLIVVHALDVPIGAITPLVIHRVREGESLPFLAKHFNTSEEAITKVNYMLSLPLWPNAIVVIPLNLFNVDNLPIFEPYQVTGDISLTSLVVDFSLDLEMVKYYNAVESEYLFTTGDWVLFPRPRVATPTG